MEYIRVSKENLEKEHICCAISNNNDIQVSSKRAWLAERFDEGLNKFVNMFLIRAILSESMQSRLLIISPLVECLKKQDFTTRVH